MQCYKFYSRFRQFNESISSFVAKLRSLAKDCDFGASLEENLHDRLVCGISNSSVQRRLLSEPNLTFKKAFEIAQSHKSAAKNIATLQDSSFIPASPTINGEVQKITPSTDSSCYRCGRTSHRANTCKFKESTCHFCGKVGHIQPVCHARQSLRPNNRSNRSSTAETSRFRSRSHRSFRPLTSDSARRNSSRRSQHQSSDAKQITVDTSNPTETVSEEYSLFSLPSGSRAPLLISVEINQVPIQIEVDTGASFTVISK